MAVKFLSKEWFELMEEGLKKEFTQEGGVTLSFVQVVEENPSGEEWWVHYELENSIFKAFTMGEGEDTMPDAPFKAFADYSTYKRVIVDKTLDGKEGLLTGDFSLEGNMAKAMALLGTYNRIEEVQRTIETEF